MDLNAKTNQKCQLRRQTLNNFTLENGKCIKSVFVTP